MRVNQRDMTEDEKGRTAVRHTLGTVLILVALAFSGCGSKDVSGDWENFKNYGNVKPQKFEFNGNTWGVFDKPDERRMIVVSLGAHGAFGSKVIERTEEAARRYLSQTGRVCEIESRRLTSATDNSIEFVYMCS